MTIIKNDSGFPVFIESLKRLYPNKVSDEKLQQMYEDGKISIGELNYIKEATK